MFDLENPRTLGIRRIDSGGEEYDGDASTQSSPCAQERPEFLRRAEGVGSNAHLGNGKCDLPPNFRDHFGIGRAAGFVDPPQDVQGDAYAVEIEEGSPFVAVMAGKSRR